MPHNIRLFSDVGAKMSMFDNKAKMHKENQMINPFSDWDGSGTRRKLSRDDPDYGKPLEGSKTAERGRQAQLQMISDMVELCDVIFDCGVRSPDGRGAICFGDVFRLYSQINDKCVGLLMRGRKHNILDFEGEMLFQRRDDDKMIELLLPLNTIRFKYGMPERAGCGEVRPDLLEQLEQQQRDKQPARCRSMEQLGLPPPPLHKSRSMELSRESARSDAAWLLKPQQTADRLGRSAENLTQISETGAVGGAAAADGEMEPVFTAVLEAAADGTSRERQAEGGAEGAVSDEGAEHHGAESAAEGVPVKWEVGDEDEGEGDTEEKQNNKEAVPAVWPEVTIVVEEDVDRKAYASQKDNVTNAATDIATSESKVDDNTLMKVNESSEQLSVPDAASVAGDSESEFDFWASTEQDPSEGGEENDKSVMESAVQTPRSGSPERAASAGSTGSAPPVEGTTAMDGIPDTEDSTGRNSEQQSGGSGDVVQDQPSQQREETSLVDGCDENGKATEDKDTTQSDEQSQIKNDSNDKEDSGFSFWDVPDEDERSPISRNVNKTERRISEMQNVESEPLAPDDSKQEDARTSDAVEATQEETKSSAEGEVKNDNTDKNENGFSFWGVTDEDNVPNDASNPTEPERRPDKATEICGETLVSEEPKREETKVPEADVPCSDDVEGKNNRTPADVSEVNKDTAPTTNGETFSFWDVSDEEDTAPSPPKPKNYFWEDETSAETTAAPATDPATLTDVRGRVPSLTDGVCETADSERSTDRERLEDAGRPGPRPLSVPHITLSDDSELMPAR